MSKPTRTVSQGALIHPIWLIRFFPVAALILVAVALLTRNHVLSNSCLGATFGLLLGFCVIAFQVEDLTLKTAGQPSDVKPYSIT